MKFFRYLPLVLICIVLFSCNSYNLTREETAQQIITHSKFPEQVTFTLYNGENLYRALLQQGLVKEDTPRQEESHESSGGGIYIPPVYAVLGYEHELSDEGKKYKVGETDDYYPIVKVADLVFGEVTGIADVIDNVKEVKYTLRHENLTPFGNITQKTGTISKTATFRKYDDGWRME